MSADDLDSAERALQDAGAITTPVDLRLHWERHPAEVASMADPNAVELELAADLLPRLGAVRQPEYATPHQSDNIRVLLPRPPYAWYEVFDQVDIAFDPQQPGRVRIIDLGAQAAPPAAKLLWLAVLAFVAWMVRRARFRPKNLMIWRIADAADNEILRFSKAMSPPEAFMALRQRISSQLDEPAPFGTENSSKALDSSRQR